MRHNEATRNAGFSETRLPDMPLEACRLVDAFQSVLDRVARTEVRESVDHQLVPELTSWGHLDSHGCSVLVKGGIWWVVPPRYEESEEAASVPPAPQSYGRLCHSWGRPWHLSVSHR